MTKKQKDILVKDRQKIDRPKKYKVVFYNDDFTPMQLVTLILMEVFNKQLPELIQKKSHKQKSKPQGCTQDKQDIPSTPKPNPSSYCSCCKCDPCDCGWGNY